MLLAYNDGAKHAVAYLKLEKFWHPCVSLQGPSFYCLHEFDPRHLEDTGTPKRKMMVIEKYIESMEQSQKLLKSQKKKQNQLVGNDGRSKF